MKKYNPCLGMASTERDAKALVEKLGGGHPIKSGGVWRVMKYPPAKVGRHSLDTKDIGGKLRDTSKTEGK